MSLAKWVWVMQKRDLWLKERAIGRGMERPVG